MSYFQAIDHKNAVVEIIYPGQRAETVLGAAQAFIQNFDVFIPTIVSLRDLKSAWVEDCAEGLANHYGCSSKDAFQEAKERWERKLASH